MANLFERVGRPAPPPTPPLGDPELAHDLRALLEWLQRRDEPTICLRDICHHGPGGIRNRNQVVELTRILVENGWLIPNQSHRRDRYVWRIVRGRNGYPTMSVTTLPMPLHAERSIGSDCLKQSASPSNRSKTGPVQ
jgi:hypothetical protein